MPGHRVLGWARKSVPGWVSAATARRPHSWSAAPGGERTRPDPPGSPRDLASRLVSSIVPALASVPLANPRLALKRKNPSCKGTDSSFFKKPRCHPRSRLDSAGLSVPRWLPLESSLRVGCDNGASPPAPTPPEGFGRGLPGPFVDRASASFAACPLRVVSSEGLSRLSWDRWVEY